MKKKGCFIGFLLFVLLACNKDKSVCYLSGTIENAPDSTFLYLTEYDSRILKDSFPVVNGEFNHQFSLQQPKKFFLHNKRNRFDFRDRKTIWFEPSEIKIVGDFSFIKNFKVQGSRSQTEFEDYTQLVEKYTKQINALGEEIHFARDKKSVENKIDSLSTVQKNELKKYLQANKNSFVVLSVLHDESYFADRCLTKTDVEEIYRNLPVSLKKTTQGVEIEKYIGLPEVPQIGEEALEIIQLTPEGETVKLSDFRGNYVLIDFWSSSCGPCRAEHKKLRDFYKKYHSKGFEILGVSGDNNREHWVNAIAEDSLTWTNVSDLKGWKNEAFLNYDVKMIPYKVLIDKEGKILMNQILCSKNWELVLAELFQRETLFPGKITITGEVLYFNQYANKNWIEFLHPDLFSPDAPFKQTKIDSTGRFRYEAELVSPALCWGIYNKWFPLVISPGDSLHLKIDATMWNDTTPNQVVKGKYVEISGTIQDDYNKIIKFQEWASDSIYTCAASRLINDAVKTKPAAEFYNFSLSREKMVRNKIADFGETHEAGKLFYEILNAEINYRTLDGLLRYWWVNPLENGVSFKDIVLPSGYFSFLEEYEMNDKDFFVMNRIDFIRELQFLLQFQNSVERETFLDIHQNKETAKISDEYFKNQAAYIDSQTWGITRDLSLCSFAFYNMEKVPQKSNSVYSAVFSLLEDPYVQKHFTEKFKAAYQKPQTVPVVRAEEFTALDSVIEKNPGKILYVDFWAPWCGPCMTEMKYYKTLRERFSGVDVEFVYLACDCSETSWESAIANNNINGINIRLTNRDYTILARRYGISGIPRYLLVNKTGELVNKNAPRPGSAKIGKLLNELSN